MECKIYRVEYFGDNFSNIVYFVFNGDADFNAMNRQLEYPKKLVIELIERGSYYIEDEEV